MNNFKILIAGFFTVFFINLSYAFEYDITTLCKHPNQPLLYVAGTYKVILIVDAENGTPKGQIELDYDVETMGFTSDGSELIVFDGSTVHFLDPQSGNQSRSFNADKVNFYADAPYFTDVSWPSNIIKVYSTKDGALVGSIKSEYDPEGVGFNSDFSELLVLGRRREIQKEKSLIQQKVEPVDGYNPFNSAYIDQQNDGKGSDFTVYNVGDMSEKMHAVLPYATSSSFDLTISENSGNYFLGCWDMLIRIDSEGKAYPIVPDEGSFTQSSAASKDGRYLVMAASEKGLIYDCSKQSLIPFDVSTEFMSPSTSDIVFAADAIYTISEDYSIIKLNVLGQSIKRFQLSNIGGSGFGVYYYNGYDAGEEQEKENSIINSTLETLSLPTINLTTFEEHDYVQIATFTTLQEAQDFMEALEDADIEYNTKFAPAKKG